MRKAVKTADQRDSASNWAAVGHERRKESFQDINGEGKHIPQSREHFLYDPPPGGASTWGDYTERVGVVVAFFL